MRRGSDCAERILRGRLVRWMRGRWRRRRLIVLIWSIIIIRWRSIGWRSIWWGRGYVPASKTLPSPRRRANSSSNSSNTNKNSPKALNLKKHSSNQTSWRFTGMRNRNKLRNKTRSRPLCNCGKILRGLLIEARTFAMKILKMSLGFRRCRKCPSSWNPRRKSWWNWPRPSWLNRPWVPKSLDCQR